MGVLVEYTGADRSVVYQEGVFLGSFAARSSTTGVGTVGAPLHFRVRPERWPTNRGIKLVPRPVDLELGAGLTVPSIPAGWEQRSPYRDYDTIHVTTMANLVANPTVRALPGWTAVEAMVIMTELAPSNLANYASIKANAALLSPVMRVFPGHRVGAHHTPAAVQVDTTGSFLFADWCSLSRWQAMADLWRDYVIPLCDPDDPRVYISAENYGASSSAEPTVVSLTAAGFNEAQVPRRPHGARRRRQHAPPRQAPDRSLRSRLRSPDLGDAGRLRALVQIPRVDRHDLPRRRRRRRPAAEPHGPSAGR